MKKYLMTGIAALGMSSLFTSCGPDMSVYNVSQSEQVLQKYEQSFVQAFGEPAWDQTWGFGSSTVAGTRGITRSNPGDTYPQTSEGINANGNEWADPNKEFGGWVVPDPLTEGQKLRVQKYFQANPNLSYEDPHFRHFFVQQVYKGGTSSPSTTPESITAANNSTYNSSHMNKLTVGQGNLHINNFNNGDCSVYGNVLDNGQTVNGGTTHSDKIQLMVNIDDTSCFGYYESGASIQVNNKAALVSAATIDAWAAANGNPGEAVVDKWNRSFMGFDHALKEGAEACERDGNGNVVYATYDQAPESPMYAWDGEKAVEIASFHQEQPDPNNPYWIQNVFDGYKDEFKTIMNRGWLSTNGNFYVAGEKVTLDQSFQVNGDPTTLGNEIKNAVILKEFTVDGTKYQSVINLPRIKQLVDAGYLPVKDKNLTEWVKVGTSDGYFSDWIVTLTEAKRIPQGGGGGSANTDTIRVIGEDLTINTNSDFDFNDIVFDVTWGKGNEEATIVLKAAGGQLPIYIVRDDDELEIHALFANANPGSGITQKTMINTTTGLHNEYKKCPQITLKKSNNDNVNWDAENIHDFASSIKIIVYKNGSEFILNAPKGDVPSKIAVGTDFEWCDERQDIDKKYFSNNPEKGKFSKYVSGQGDWNNWYHNDVNND